MQLYLSDEDADLLRGVLTDYLPTLEREVARTEHRDFRHLLIQRQEVVERFLEQLGEQTR
jgi:hypothetical protein